MITKDTPNGRVISHCPVSPELAAAADECFVAYKALNEKVERLYAAIPEGFAVRNFFGKGNCVIIDSAKEIEADVRWREENS